MVAPTEIAEAIIAALIIVMGLVALALGAARLVGRPFRDLVRRLSPASELRAWTSPEAELQDDLTVVVVDVLPTDRSLTAAPRSAPRG